MKASNTIIIGDAVVDTTIRLPKSDLGIDTLMDMTPEMSAGGTVGNTAVALARLGIDVGLVFAVGADGYGEFLKRDLANAGVEIRYARIIPGRFTLNVIVIIDRSGERFFFVHPADDPASYYYPPEELDLTGIAQAGWLHTAGSCFESGSTREAVLIAMKCAKQVGIPVSLDLNLRPRENALPESYRETLHQAVGLADFVLGSADDEIAYYTGIDNSLEAAKALAGDKRTVVARLGARGCIVVTSSGDVCQVPGFKVQVVDTMGAGDVFDAGFIAANLEGMPVIEAARWGNALAALSVSHEGAAQQLSREAMERLLLYN